MNDMQIYINEKFGQVRTVTIDGEPWLVGRDVAAALGYANTKDALSSHVDAEDKMQGDGVAIRDPLGRVQHPVVINESGLYSLVLSSKLPGAKEFRRWITSEVLPSIRKHGAYLSPEAVEEVLLSPDTLIHLAQQIKDERAERVRLEAKIAEDAPKVLFADVVAGSGGTMLVREFARQLRQYGVDIGEKRLYEDLRRRGYLVRAKGRDHNKPTQKSVDRGLFTSREVVISHSDGTTSVRVTPYLTGKGRQFFTERYCGPWGAKS